MTDPNDYDDGLEDVTEPKPDNPTNDPERFIGDETDDSDLDAEDE